MRHIIVRLALLIVPASWRLTVASDLEDESRAGGRGAFWLPAQILLTGIRLRATVSLDAVAADVRNALRALARAPWFATAAIVTFALGIGANVAVFSVVDRIVFRPLPFRDVDRLVQIHQLRIQSGSPEAFLGLPLAITQKLYTGSPSFEGLAYAAPARGVIGGLGDGPVAIVDVSHNLLAVLGVKPILGRDFTMDDGLSQMPGVMLSFAAWQTYFGGAQDVTSKTLRRGGRTHAIIGVLPRDFVLPSSRLVERIDVLAVAPYFYQVKNPQYGFLTVAPIGRLRPGITREVAQAEVSALALGLRAAQPSPVPERLASPIEVLPIQSGIFLNLRPYVWLAVTAGALVVLLACANLSTMLLARGRSRERDVALSSALGASRTRLVMGTLVEATVLCVAGGAIAILSVAAIRRWMLDVLPPAVRALALMPFDQRLLSFALGAAVLCALAAAVGPALRATRVDMLTLLQSGRQSGTRSRLRGAMSLLVLEAALGVILVAGAAMTARNLLQLVFKDPGFRSADVYRGHIQHGANLDRAAAPGFVRNDRTEPATSARVQAVTEVLTAVQGIAVAGLVGSPFPSAVEHEFWKSRGSMGGVWGMGPGVFDAMSTPLRSGRTIEMADVTSRGAVAVVNERAVSVLWPGISSGDALGRFVETESGPRQVIGVVADIRPYPGAEQIPALYLPITDALAPRSATAINAVIRMQPGHRLDGPALDRALDARLGSQNASVTVFAEELGPWFEQPRFQAVVFVTFALVALTLAAAGLYAVASFSVARRRYEMGVRSALGADGRDLRRLVFVEAVRPMALGIAAGCLMTWWAATFLQAFLFEVDARDPWTYLLVGAVLLATAMLATWIPARRAARTDPAAVLREG
jgi:predicted permease